VELQNLSELSFCLKPIWITSETDPKTHTWKFSLLYLRKFWCVG